jgi:1,4-dihydroxy-2-naphthoate polyprenyltransferase
MNAPQVGDRRGGTPPAPTLSDLARIVELRTKVVSLSSLGIGTLWAALGGAFSWTTFGLMLGATLCVDLATAGFNSYYDHRDGVDTIATDVDGYKVLVQRGIDPKVALRASMALFAGAVVLGLALGWRVGWEVVGVGAVCMAVAWGYSGGPWPISRLPVGELFAGGAMGLVLLSLSVYVQTRTVELRTLALSLPSTCLIAAILAANNACDRVGDAAAGRRTLAIVVGARRAPLVVEWLVGAGFGAALLLAATRVLPPFAALPLAAAALLAFRLLRAMRRRGYAHATKGRVMGGISGIFLAYSLGVVASLGIELARRGSS